MRRLEHLDALVLGFLNRWAVPALRVSLGIVFVWFGALKVFDVTPVSDLVTSTVYWFDSAWIVPILGILEILVGLGLLFGVLLRLTLLLFAFQMVGTFLVLVLLPEISFQDGNLLLTVEGEFVVKNLVLLSAGMVVGTTVRARDRSPDDSYRARGVSDRWVLRSHRLGCRRRMRNRGSCRLTTAQLPNPQVEALIRACHSGGCSIGVSRMPHHSPPASGAAARWRCAVLRRSLLLLLVLRLADRRWLHPRVTPTPVRLPRRLRLRRPVQLEPTPTTSALDSDDCRSYDVAAGAEGCGLRGDSD